jgi:hypothetical protein
MRTMLSTGTIKTYTYEVRRIDFYQLRHVRHGHSTLDKWATATEMRSGKLFPGY